MEEVILEVVFELGEACSSCTAASFDEISDT